jgi:hypothetical protein
MQPASEREPGVSRDLGGTDRQPSKTFADPQLPQQFEIDQDQLEDHEGDLFFYEFDMAEEFRRLELMKELEKRRAWAERHLLREEDEEDNGGEEGPEETVVSFSRSQVSNLSHFQKASPQCSNGSDQQGEDGRPAPWGSFDWRVSVAEYVLEYGQEEEEPLSPEQVARVDQVLFQTFPGLRKYYEEHPEEYSASLNSDLEIRA